MSADVVGDWKSPRKREWALTLRILWHSTVSRLGILVLTGFVLISVFGPLLAPYDPLEIDLSRAKLHPSPAHWLGTDLLGRDILSRILHGAIISLSSGFIVVGMAVFIGVTVGLISGFFEKTIGQVLMRMADIFLAFPILVLAIALAATFGPSLRNALLAMSMAYWPRYARLMYGETLSVMQSDYVKFAKTINQSNLRIMLAHVIPNTISPIVIQASLDFGDAILLAAVLGFLGLGAQPPSPEWGAMVAQGRDYLFNFWWMSIVPGFTIFSVALAFNFLGDGIRDALDPNLRRMKKL